MTVNAVVAILALIVTALVAMIPALITIGVTINKISVITTTVTKLEAAQELNAVKFGKRIEALEVEKKIEDRVRRITRGDMPPYVPPEESGKRET